MEPLLRSLMSPDNCLRRQAETAFAEATTSQGGFVSAGVSARVNSLASAGRVGFSTYRALMLEHNPPECFFSVLSHIVVAVALHMHGVSRYFSVTTADCELPGPIDRLFARPSDSDICCGASAKTTVLCRRPHVMGETRHRGSDCWSVSNTLPTPDVSSSLFLL